MAMWAILQLKKDSYLIKSSEKFKIKRSKDRKQIHKYHWSLTMCTDFHSHQSQKKLRSSGIIFIDLLLPISKHLGKLNSTFHVFVAYFGYSAAT